MEAERGPGNEVRSSYSGKTTVFSDAVWYQGFAQLEHHALANFLGPESSFRFV